MILFRPPPSERSVTVSVSLRSPERYLLVLGISQDLRISRPDNPEHFGYTSPVTLGPTTGFPSPAFQVVTPAT